MSPKRRIALIVQERIGEALVLATKTETTKETNDPDGDLPTVKNS